MNRPIVEVRNLRVRYPNGAIGVSDVSVSASDGEVVALFGPNGAGKTTTVRAISGFDGSERVSVSGSIEICGRSTAGWEPQRLASLGLSLVPERDKIFPNLTVIENLNVVRHRPPRSERKRRLEHVLNTFPALSSRLREVAGRLSGGQQQMVALGRAMLSNPRVLLVDEITLGLHQSIHAQMFDVVRNVADAGAAVLLVGESTHHALRVADSCYLLSGGRIRLQGLPSLFEGNELLTAGYVE